MYATEAQLGRFFLEMWGQQTRNLDYEKFRQSVEPLFENGIFGSPLLESYINFDSEKYTRNLICQTPQFMLLVMCWKTAQFSSVHDHEGSFSAVYVRSGEMTSRTFVKTTTVPAMFEKEEHITHGGCVLGNNNIIHQLGNTGNSDLVTVHIYSPPLHSINCYDLERSTVSRIHL